MRIRSFSKKILLAFGSVLAAARCFAGNVDHFALSPIASPQRVGVPFPVTVTALDSNGVIAANFSGPVQFFFSDHATPAYFNDFSNGFQFDTDGDGTSDGANLRIISGSGVYYGNYGFTLNSNTVYSLSLDYAINPNGSSALLFGPDAVLYGATGLGQIGSWGGWFPPNQVSRFSAYTEFGSFGEGTHTLDLRYWLPLGGSASIYTDNIRIRVRDISPGFVIFSQGQWTGNLEPFRTGTNLVLRAQNNNGQSGDSNPINILPRVADISVTMLPHDFLPVAQWAWIRFLLTNAGPSSIESVVVTNELPAGFTFIQTVPYDGSQLASNRIVTFLGAIPGQSAMEFDLIIQRDQAGVIPVTASLSVPDYDTNPSNHTASGSVTFVPVLTGADVTVTETPGGTNAMFHFQLNATNAQPLAVNYALSLVSATPGTDYVTLAPGTVIFSAGSTQQSVAVPVLDDVFYEANEQFVLMLSVTNLTPVILTATNFTATIVSDDPLPTLTISLPPNAMETTGTLSNAGWFTISAPFEQDIRITITSSDQTEILSPGAIILPAGETNAAFNLPVVDDFLYDPDQTVTITASCTNGISGTAQMVVFDNEMPNLTVTASFKPAEGNGTVTNGMRVTSPIALATNITITLVSSDTTEMLVPASVVLLAGTTFTNFSATVVDDTETDGPQNVTIIASAPGFTSGSNTLSVTDNDVHHFTVGSGQNASIGNKTSTVPFSVSITAKDAASNTLTGFTQAVALTATSDLGFVVLSPSNTSAFSRGSWFGSVTISNGDYTNVRIVAPETNGASHSGQSNPFRVYATAAQQLRILGAQIVGNDVQVFFNSVTGRHYRLETASDPTGATWNVVVPNVTGLGGAVTVTNVGGFSAPRQFHRVALQP